MTPDAPHGTLRRYRQGCREECCRRANTRRMNLYRLGRADRHIPGEGTRRRIRALRRIGWRIEDIAAAAGIPHDTIKRLLATQRAGTTVRASTAAAVAKAYDQLSMTLGNHPHAARHAIRGDWPPPLAWDDESIDDPDAKPYKARRKGADPELDEIDPVIVDRAMNGERVKANVAERAEVVRRWITAGRSRKSLEEAQGWNLNRDGRRSAA